MTTQTKEQPAEIVEQTFAKPRPEKQETELATIRTMTPGQLATFLSAKDGVDVEKLARLMELQEHHEDREARKAFIQALAIFTARVMPITKTRKVDFTTAKGRTHYRFAGLPETFEQVQPLMTDCQLTLTFTSVPPLKAGNVRLRGVLSHGPSGHTEYMELEAGPDETGNKNSAQAIGSIISYLRRMIAFCMLGLIAKDEIDNDGANGAPPTAEKPPESERSIQDPERADKDAFVTMCRRKAGDPNLATGIVKVIYEQVKQMSGKAAVKECLAWADCKEVLIGKDGTVSTSWEQA